MEALERLMKGRTVITIAHRLVRFAIRTKSIVLKEGVVAEEGTHDELLGQGRCLRRSLPDTIWYHQQPRQRYLEMGSTNPSI